jgi:hypothetical protein
MKEKQTVRRSTHLAALELPFILHAVSLCEHTEAVVLAILKLARVVGL